MRHSLGRRADGEPVCSWHAQNLNERRRGPDGPWWRHSRAWLHWYGWRPQLSRLTLGVEWVLFRKDTGFNLGLEICSDGNDYDLATRLALPFLGALYFNVAGLFPLSWSRDSKEFSIQLYQEYLWVEFWWTDPGMTWGENRNRFPAFRISFDWMSFLFGKQQHRLEYPEGEHTWHHIDIPMLEHSYAGRYRVERRTWWRPRWPKKLVRVSADIDIPGGILIPGKGDSSWDCGEDALMGMGCSEYDDASVIATVVKNVLSTRSRYASIDWVPAENPSST